MNTRSRLDAALRFDPLNPTPEPVRARIQDTNYPVI